MNKESDELMESSRSSSRIKLSNQIKVFGYIFLLIWVALIVVFWDMSKTIFIYSIFLVIAAIICFIEAKRIKLGKKR